ncbi:MAG TPA: hypothetical protein VGM77_05985 [Gemmatimonadales bacterium]|jgi:hypothetical protein
MKPSLTAVLFVLSACSSGALVAPVSTPITVTGNLGSPGLEQTVTLSTSTVAVGDSVSIRSVVVNRGAEAATVGVACWRGVGLSGVSFDPSNDQRCASISLEQLRPGDSLVETMTTPPVTSTPGSYTLVVRQLYVESADGGVSIPVHVLGGW